MPFFDTHAHLEDSRFDEDRDAVFQRCTEENVVRVVNPGVTLERSRAAVRLAERVPWIHAAVGVSPHDVKHTDDAQMEALIELAGHPRVVAWGEIGLDYHHMLSPREDQHRWLRVQLRIARRLNLPVIIHFREAGMDLFEIFEDEGLPGAGGVMHSFTGNREEMQRALSLGMYVSFSGIVTFKRSREEFADRVREVPGDRLLAETDSPYLAPQAHRRAGRCEPWMIRDTIACIAEARGETVERMIGIVQENAERFFGLARSEGAGG